MTPTDTQLHETRVVAPLREHRAAIINMHDLRFDRALGRLHDADDLARVSLDTETGLAVGLDAHVIMPMPPAARALPSSDRAAAAAVLFIDRYGDLFGITGWHMLEPKSAAPLGETIWFCFDTQLSTGEPVELFVCCDESTVRFVRVELDR
jgi:hypothetical protein